MDQNQDKQSKAKEYNRVKQNLSLINLGVSIVVLLIPVITPLSAWFKNWAEGISQLPLLVVAIYFFFYSIYSLLIEFPFSYYSGHVLEHKYQLSNQKFQAWLLTHIKKTALSFLFSTFLILGLYSIIWNFPDKWWLIAWGLFVGVSYVMGKLFPVFIVPMFYKYGKVEDEALRERIIKMAQKYGMPVENLYSLNLSKTTKKANAAFMGIGKTKRVVLSDTLLENFNHDEIEMVLAHELGHFKHKDIWKQLGFGVVSSFIGFFIASKVLGPAATSLGYQGVADVAGLPLLFLIFYLFSLILMPLQNGFSRVVERAADRFALEIYPQPNVFISAMEKLASVNLADPEPNELYEWFFYDHPAIGKRIAMARGWKTA